MNLQRANQAAKIATDDYLEAVNELHTAQADSHEAWIDLQYQKKCRAEGGGHNNGHQQLGCSAKGGLATINLCNDMLQ